MKIRCEYCQNMVDARAVTCPFCGGPMPEAPKQPTPAPVQKKIGKSTVAILLVLALALGLGAYLLSRSKDSSAGSAASITEALNHVNAGTADGPTYQTVVTYYLEGGDLEAAHRAAREMLEQTDAGEYGPWCVEQFLTFGRRDLAANLAAAGDALGGKQELLPLVYDAPLSELLPESPLRQVMELVMGTTAENITLEQLQSVTELSIQSPDILTGAQEISVAFDAGVPVTVVVEAGQDGGELGLIYFQGLQCLEVAVRGVSAQDLLLPELRELSLPAGTDGADLNDYAGLSKLERLYVGGYNLTSLDGLDKLPALTALTLCDTKITDLSALSSQQQITELGLLGNEQLTSVASLSMASHLEKLSLSGTALTDLTPLSSLSNLASLSVDGSAIRDAAFLAGMTGLKELTLTGNDELTSVPELANLSALERLSLESDELFASQEDMTALSSLRALKIRVTRDFSYLRPLEHLEELTVCSYQSALDLSSLSQFLSLKRLSFQCGWFADTYTTSLEGLDGLRGLPLEYLSLRDKSVYGPLDAVLELPTLQVLDLSGADSEGTDYQKLANLSQLRELNLNGYRNMVDTPPGPGEQYWSYEAGPASVFIDQLGLLNSLETLHMAECGAEEIGSLGALSGLTYLDLSNNKITDISPLAALDDLTFLNLSGNRIADLSAVEGRAGLTLIR